MKCPKCKKTHTVKHGYVHRRTGLTQRYLCKHCGYKFINDDGFKQFRTNPKIITAALDLRAKGLSLAEVVDHLGQHHNVKVSRKTVLDWQNKFGEKLHSFTQSLTPFLGLTYHADEMFARVSGTWNYLWSCIDYLTKFIVAHHFSVVRNDIECTKFIGKVKTRTKNPPNEIHTDNSWDYYPAFRKHFPRNRKIHKHFPAWKHSFKNNPIERFFNTVKQRYKTLRTFDNTDSASKFLCFYMVYYNFIRKHMSLNGITPAQAAKIELNLGKNRFMDLIRKAIYILFNLKRWLC